ALCACDIISALISRYCSASCVCVYLFFHFFFFFNDTAPTEIYTLSLHDALPISHRLRVQLDDEVGCRDGPERGRKVAAVQSVPGDDDVIRQRLLARRDPRGTKPR